MFLTAEGPRVSRFLAATSGLLIFAAMILRGVFVDNPADVVLSRALVGLLVGLILGGLSGAVAQRVLREIVEGRRAEAAAASAEKPEAPGPAPTT